MKNQAKRRWVAGLLGLLTATAWGTTTLLPAQPQPQSVMQEEEVMDPMADAAAVVVSGHARFTVLTPQMIRIQYSTKNLFEDRASFAIVNRRLPVPSFTTEERDGYLFLTTEALTLRYKIGSTLRAGTVSTDNLRITFTLGDKEILWYEGKDDAMNLMGTGRTMDADIGDTQRPTIEQGILSRDGWAIIDESPRTMRGDGSRSFVFDGMVDGVPWVAKPVDEAAIDWYFLGYGHDYKQALNDYVRVAGRQPLPPRWMFGYWYSKYQAYSTADYQTLVRDMETKAVPHDVMMMDMDWHKEGWTGWTWNKKLIPSPSALLTYMHKHDLKVALNLHPADGISNGEDGFAAIRSDMGLATSATNVPWMLEDSTFYRTFFKNIIRVREKEGVDFWWIDWQQDLTNSRLAGLGQTFWLNHVFYNDMAANRTDRRPVIFHRWGGLGSHRYPLGFSGDTFATYGTLDFESYWTATASNVAFGYWGHDGGGYLQPADQRTDPELVLRWMQFAVFQPIFRTHGSSQSASERRVWKMSNFDLIREAFDLRYHLLPYIYTAARQGYDTGVSICRPLYYDWPEENKAYSIENEYLFGDDILVSPIAAPSEGGVTTRRTWLPDGRWYDAMRGRLIQGGTTITDQYGLNETPYFIRQGSIIPCLPKAQSLKAQPDSLLFEIIPGASGSATVYEDDGDSQAYRHGRFATMTIRQERTAESIAVLLAPWQGTYDGMPVERRYRLLFLAEEQPKVVFIAGQPTDRWSYDAHTRTLSVTLPTMASTDSTSVKVILDDTAVAPLPADDLTLRFDQATALLAVTSSLPMQQVHLRVLSSDGTLCASPAPLRSEGVGDRLSFSLATLPAGSYLCQVNADGRTVTRKVLILPQ